MSKTEKFGKVTLTTWYVNVHRVVELTGVIRTERWGDPATVASLLGRPFLLWVQMNHVPSLARLLATGRLRAGQHFFHDGRFYSRGFGSASYRQSIDVKLWFPLADLAPGRSEKMEVHFNTASLTTTSAYGALQGTRRLFVAGVVERTNKATIVARPYLIGYLVEDYGGIDPQYANQTEIRPADFGSFRKVDFTRYISPRELDALRAVSEAEIKRIFAKAMSESFTDKDWGGEAGDLFTANPTVDGKRCACAFMFKGPAKFKKLQPADCGKNGDQIVRLFDLPAEVFVLQHCHAVAPAVRRMMQAFAVEKLPKRARFCIIDGRDTYLILKYLRELPMASTRRRKASAVRGAY